MKLANFSDDEIRSSGVCEISGEALLYPTVCGSSKVTGIEVIQKSGSMLFGRKALPEKDAEGSS